MLIARLSFTLCLLVAESVLPNHGLVHLQAYGDAVIDEAPMFIISNHHVTVFLKRSEDVQTSAYGRLSLSGGISNSQVHALVGSGLCTKPLSCIT